MRLPSQMRSGPRITSHRLTIGVMPSAHELKTMSLSTLFDLKGQRLDRAEHLCGRGESLCWGHINLQSETIPYVCCPKGWECVRRNGMPDCKLPNDIQNWFKNKLGGDVFGEIMRRISVIAK